jgi:hypothetical protein
MEMFGTVEVNPLLWYNAELTRPRDTRFPNLPMSMDQSFFEYLCRPYRSHFKSDTLVPAYRKITGVEKKTPLRAIVSSDPRLKHRLIFPLKNAKVAFLTENYLGTIALCGLIAEMIAILLFELHERKLDETRLKHALAAERARLPFDEVRQERRVRVLKRLRLITPRQVKWFGTIRDIRNRHLHFFRPDGGSEKEALLVYEAALGLIYTITRASGSRGKLSTNPLLMDMLRRQGRTVRYVRKPAPATVGTDGT